MIEEEISCHDLIFYLEEWRRLYKKVFGVLGSKMS
jgi:hypothetical protein